jgi:hypothetical protein
LEVRMERREVVRLLVMDAICDDCENIDQMILQEVAKSGARCGLTIERAEVVDTLAGLIADGLAAARLLSSTEASVELPGMPAVDEVEEYFKTYFHLTKKGMELQLSDNACWPFDDGGNPIPDRIK